jgi:glycopeptide antibiotics resistance protein
MTQTTYVHNYGIKMLLFISAIVIWSCTLYFILHLQDLWRGKNPWGKPTSSLIQNSTNSAFNEVGLLWCEKKRPMDFMAEPSNAISNFAYLLVGILMVMFPFMITFLTMIQTDPSIP